MAVPFSLFLFLMKTPDSIVLITGGQTGVDRAVLDFALHWGLTCGGWCPKGRLAEDGKIPERYPVREWQTALYEDRTRQNILDSDGVLIVFGSTMDKGTRLTHQLAKKLGKPHLVQPLELEKDYAQVNNWLTSNNIQRLNIAGPRESSEKGIYDKTFMFLKNLYEVP